MDRIHGLPWETLQRHKNMPWDSRCTACGPRNQTLITPEIYTENIQNAMLHQADIGWQQSLEGLLASTWTQIQAQHCKEIRNKKTGTAWATGLIKAQATTGRDQWRHRVKHKHELGKPRHKAHVFKLNKELLQELTRGTKTLLPGDQCEVNCATLELLAKTPSFKTSWLLNGARARQRFLRIKQNNDEL